MPPVPPLLRASLPATRPANGYGSMQRSCKKVVLEYCDTWGSNDGMRRFILNKAIGPEAIARSNPSVEFVVRRRPFKHPVVRGLYRARDYQLAFKVSLLTARLIAVNNRDKVICVRNLEPVSIAQKIQLVLDSSGEKLRPEKGHPVKSINESVRGRDWIACAIRKLANMLSSTRYLLAVSQRMERRRQPWKTTVAATSLCISAFAQQYQSSFFLFRSQAKRCLHHFCTKQRSYWESPQVLQQNVRRPPIFQRSYYRTSAWPAEIWYPSLVSWLFRRLPAGEPRLHSVHRSCTCNNEMNKRLALLHR
jgi:large subunit ribosomal protein L43